jgi:DNA-binding IclR family transcriptional regulator
MNPGVESIAAQDRVAVLLAHPLRLRILAGAREPASATQIAQRLKLPRQKVNYHVRELARARFLRRAGQARKRNMIEQRWVATANSYALSPELLGDLQANPATITDAFSAQYLLALASRSQAEITRAATAAAAQGKRLSTLAIDCEFRFESAVQRAAFARALTESVTALIERHTSPASGEGRPYRLIVGCHPIPPKEV